MKFSEKVRKLRIRKGLSQEELAEKLDVSRQTVSNGKQAVLCRKLKSLYS